VKEIRMMKEQWHGTPRNKLHVMHVSDGAEKMADCLFYAKY
jgi:hypothetical protein